jgi:N-methylhydantoinase A
MRLGVDVGGTFTDAVLVSDDGRLCSAKSLTTPGDQSEGVLAAVRAVLDAAGAEPREVRDFAHGMTVATNALLEGRGARTAFVATEGFTDLVALGRQNRPELYRLCAARPAPLAPPARRFGARERMGPNGVERPLHELEALVEAVRDSEAEAVAVCLLHAYRHPEHELAIGEALADELDGVHVSLSHEVVGTFREYERAATTELDAALSPLLAGYLRRLLERCDAAELPEPAIMQSAGGLIDLPQAAAHAVWTVLSGPAGGAAGAAYVARASHAPNALCFDMGGTSCDVCVVDGGAVQERAAGEIAGRPLALPMVAVHTVGAGGGSIAWRDPGGALRVGPRSAGADPGPAGYGRGGREPTVTDANLVLGRLPAGGGLAGGVALDPDAAAHAVDELGTTLGMDRGECAAGIVRVANAEMVRALRVVTVERGIDPRGYALLAFGGAGPLHAAEIAVELGITEIVIPRASGVLAALGLIVAPQRRDVQRSVFLSGEGLTAGAIAGAAAELGDTARRQLHDPGAELSAVYELRYRGQAFELGVGGGLAETPGSLREAFEALHEERYGYRDAAGELELVTLRVSAQVPGAEVTLGEHRGESDGAPVPGPRVIALPEATVWIPAGWSGTSDADGTLRLERAG